MSSELTTFTKDNLDTYLKELAKEYRKLGGRKMPAELIIIGGASVLINYGFRDMTTDIDAIISAASTMKEAVNHVTDKYNLPEGWLNDDFKRTDSYSTKLSQYSEYYKSFYGVLTVRTITKEYLIAMKLKSGRQFKNDLSDILGILYDQQISGSPISLSDIQRAAADLYGSWNNIPDTSRNFIAQALSNGAYKEMIKQIRSEEADTKNALIDFENKYPTVTNTANVDDIIAMLRKKM